MDRENLATPQGKDTIRETMRRILEMPLSEFNGLLSSLGMEPVEIGNFETGEQGEYPESKEGQR